MIKIKVDEYRETEHEETFFDVQDVKDEIVKRSPEIDWNTEPCEKAWNKAIAFINSVFNNLPNVKKHDIEWMDIEVSTNGDEFLFRYENDCENVADLLDQYLFKYSECHTGYYNPEEDKRSNCEDSNTGWYYINWD